MNNSEILIYQAADDKIKIDVCLEDETVWLTQDHMAGLFGKSKKTISEHIRNSFREGELEEHVVVRNFRITTAPCVPSKADTASGTRRERFRGHVGNVSGKIPGACREKPSIIIPEPAELMGITGRSVQRNIQILQKDGLFRRIGGRKKGPWEVIE